ncbi:teashirt homolog 3-like [Tigriopus californicus]|nr:teashirt homolog 3-like [Tigriopus californicus]
MGRRKQHCPKRTNEGSEECGGPLLDEAKHDPSYPSQDDLTADHSMIDEPTAMENRDDKDVDPRFGGFKEELLRLSMESLKSGPPDHRVRPTNPEMAKLLQLQAAHGMALQARMMESRQPPTSGPLDLTNTFRGHSPTMAYPQMPSKLPRIPTSQASIPFPFHLMSSNLSLPTADLEKRIFSEFKSFPGLWFPRFNHPGLLAPINPYANLFVDNPHSKSGGGSGGGPGGPGGPGGDPTLTTMSTLQRMSELAKTSNDSSKLMRTQPASWSASRRVSQETNAEIFKCVWCQERYSTLADLTAHLKEAKHNSLPGSAPHASSTPPSMMSPSTSSPSHDEFRPPSKPSSPNCKSPKDSSKEHSINVPRKLVRGQDVWLGKGQEQTRQILKCMWCGESFKSLADMTVHMQETKHYTKVISQEQLSSWRTTTSGSDDKLESPIGSPPSKTPGLIPSILSCKVCDKSYPTLKELGDHMVEDNHSEGKDQGLENSSRKRSYTPKEKKKKSLSVRKLLELERNSMDGTDFQYKRSKTDFDHVDVPKKPSDSSFESSKQFQYHLKPPIDPRDRASVGSNANKPGKSGSILGSLEKMIETNFGNKKRSANGSILQRCGIEDSPEHPPPNSMGGGAGAGGGPMFSDPVHEFFKSQFAAAAVAISKHSSMDFKANSVPMNMLHRLINEQKNMSVTKSEVVTSPSSGSSSSPSGVISSFSPTIHKSNDNDLTMKMKADSSSLLPHHPLEALRDMCSSEEVGPRQRKIQSGEAVVESSLNLSSPSQESFQEDNNNSSSSTASSPQPEPSQTHHHHHHLHRQPRNQVKEAEENDDDHHDRDALASLPMGRSQSVESPPSNNRENEDGTPNNGETTYKSEPPSTDDGPLDSEAEAGQPDENQVLLNGKENLADKNRPDRNFQIRKIIMNDESSSESKFLKYSELAKQLSGR